MNGRCSVQRGVALMLVLWALALLTIIAVGLTTAQRTKAPWPLTNSPARVSMP